MRDPFPKPVIDAAEAQDLRNIKRRAEEQLACWEQFMAPEYDDSSWRRASAIVEVLLVILGRDS